MSLETIRDHEQRLKALERGAGAGRPLSDETWRAIVGPDIVLYAPFNGDPDDHSGFGDVGELDGDDYAQSARNAADPSAAIGEVINLYNALSDPNRVNFGVTGGADIVVPIDEQWLIGSDVGLPIPPQLTPLNNSGGFGAFVITGPFSSHYSSGVAGKLPGSWPVVAKDGFGRNNRAYRFFGGSSGQAGQISWPYQSRHSITDEFSIAFSFTVNSTPPFNMVANKSGFDDGWNVILEQGGGPTFRGISFSTWVGTNREQIFSGDNGKFFSDGDYVRCVCTRFATGLQQIFINGDLFFQAIKASGPIDDDTERIQVGANYEDVGLEGNIDEFYLIKRGLSYFEAVAYGLIK